jgi:nucleotide-binding universal stress UspA family protein
LDGYRTAALAVVVGVDGSDVALHAVRWATKEARRRGAPLRIVHVTPYAERGVASERRAESIVTSARTTAEQTWPDAEISTACVAGHAAPALAESAADAQLLVVAMGGGERYEDIRLHSTALSVCTAAKCPVAVVRSVAGVVPDDGPVVLGVENVDSDAVAVTVAFADAQRHGTGLVVVHGVRGTGLLRDHLIGLTAITEELAPWRSRYPEVPVEIRVVDLPAPGHLLQAAVRARLVVVGTRGRNLATRLVLGSVSHTVVRNAPCPVVVVRRDTQLAESAPYGAVPAPEKPAHPSEPWAVHRHDRRQRG